MNNNISFVSVNKKIIAITGLIIALGASLAIGGGPEKTPNINIVNPLSDTTQVNVDEITGETCSQYKPMIDKTAGIESSILNRLSDYEELCGSFVADEMMIFTDTPVNTEKAKSKAQAFSKVLKEFSESAISPLVVFEPVTDDGFVSYQEIIDGKFDDIYKTYFNELKTAGLSDEEMGTWVHLPESNTPIWNHDGVDQEGFGNVYNKIAGFQKETFPNSKSTVLLNSQSYESDDIDWEFGEYSSFSPFLENINRELIDSFGVQGLPWISPADRSSNLELLDASDFVQIDLTIDAARELGIDDIWINTGSFSEKYTTNIDRARAVPTIKRESTLNTIFEQAKQAKDSGLNVTINLFSEDKSGTPEDTNWTYLDSDKNKQLFKDFATKTLDEDISISLFDR